MNEKVTISQERRGTGHLGVRERHERMVLTLLRRAPELAKAEIARRTGLSAQTVSRLIAALEADGLILRGDPQRGRVGQPSVPLRLNPEGAVFLGLKVGRRSVELVATDFLGQIIAREKRVYDYPDYEDVLTFSVSATQTISDRIGPARAGRVAGLGVAMPFHLWAWAGRIGVAPERMADWQSRDLQRDLQAQLELPVFVQNDATAACSAELVFGHSGQLQNFASFFVAFFIGGGLVLDGSLYAGSHGNAAGFGPVVVPDLNGVPRPLIDLASLVTLEARLVERGGDMAQIWTDPEGWDVPGDLLEPWLAEAANGLAQAIRSTQSILDLDAVLIDGWLPDAVRAALVEQTRAGLAALDTTGMDLPEVLPGTIGPDARCLGAASLPLTARFLIEYAD